MTTPTIAVRQSVGGSTLLHIGTTSWMRALFRDRLAVVGLTVLVTFGLMAAVAPALAPHDPAAVDVARRLAPPSWEFPLGTDHLGRDIASRLLYGARISLGATIAASVAIAAIGAVLGMAAGFLGGAVDMLISRVVDVLLAFPGLLLALALTGVLGPSLRNVMIAVVVVAWAGYARVVRSAVLAERERAYIEAARVAGASRLRLVARHIAPNVLGPVVVLTTLDMAAILLSISALSFLGLGVQPPTAEWGSMLSEGRPYLTRAPLLMLFPGLAIFLAALAFNLVGDGVRDVLDPRTRGIEARRQPHGRWRRVSEATVARSNVIYGRRGAGSHRRPWSR